jgi:BASS family bile acid:Na+ symporter
VLLSLLLVQTLPQADLRIDYLAIAKTLVVFQLLPLAIGLIIHQSCLHLTRRVARPIQLLANALMAALIVAIIGAQYQTLAEIRLRGWAGMATLLLASLGIGWICGGANKAARKAIAITTAPRNAAVGLAIATSNFAGTPAVTAAVAYGLVSMIGALGFALVARGVGVTGSGLPSE